MGIDIFEFQDPVEYLNAVYQEKRRSNPSFSMRAWAKQLKAPPSMLSMVLTRKRRLLPALGQRIGASLGLRENPARYFEMLILYNNTKTIEEKEFYSRLLPTLRPDQSFVSLQLDRFRVIAEWHHFAILQMTDLPSFENDPQHIARRLGKEVSKTQVSEAIGRLKRLGLLEIASNGKLRKTETRLATPTDVPDEGLRRFHSQVITKAMEALESQSVERRDITAHMVPTRYEKIAEAKKMIREFRGKLAKFLADDNAETVYQVNIQLFDLLEKEKEKEV